MTSKTGLEVAILFDGVLASRCVSDGLWHCRSHLKEGFGLLRQRSQLKVLVIVEERAFQQTGKALLSDLAVDELIVVRNTAVLAADVTKAAALWVLPSDSLDPPFLKQESLPGSPESNIYLVVPHIVFEFSEAVPFQGIAKIICSLYQLSQVVKRVYAGVSEQRRAWDKSFQTIQEHQILSLTATNVRVPCQLSPRAQKHEHQRRLYLEFKRAYRNRNLGRLRFSSRMSASNLEIATSI